MVIHTRWPFDLFDYEQPSWDEPLTSPNESLRRQAHPELSGRTARSDQDFEYIARLSLAARFPQYPAASKRRRIWC
jgi:hypothetical protein